jgi:hypothetical protein
MQKKSNQPAKPGIQKASSNISKPASQPQAVRKIPPVPPKPMITAFERKALKQQRRSAPNLNLARAQVVSPAAAATNEALQAECNRFNTLQSKIMLTEVNDDLEDIESAINALPANIENIRARGYVFKAYLERKVETLATQWRDLRPRVQTAIQTQMRALQTDATSVQNTLNRGALAGTALAALESKTEAALRNLQGMYDTLDDNVNQTQQQVDDVSWTLQQAEQASFGFFPTEAPVEAAPANWKRAGDQDGVEGVLFLTDQRLLFEQKEEVATKKVLFITTEKQKLQNLTWEVPVAQIESALGSKRGFLGKDDYLTITCGSEAPFRIAEIHLKGETGEAWQSHIGRVKSGEIAKERTTPVDQAAVEMVSNAPTKCPTCGATITQTIVRGQTEMTCEFCGSKIRL